MIPLKIFAQLTAEDLKYLGDHGWSLVGCKEYNNGTFNLNLHNEAAGPAEEQELLEHFAFSWPAKCQCGVELANESQWSNHYLIKQKVGRHRLVRNEVIAGQLQPEAA